MLQHKKNYFYPFIEFKEAITNKKEGINFVFYNGMIYVLYSTRLNDIANTCYINFTMQMLTYFSVSKKIYHQNEFDGNKSHFQQDWGY